MNKKQIHAYSIEVALLNKYFEIIIICINPGALFEIFGTFYPNISF